MKRNTRPYSLNPRGKTPGKECNNCFDKSLHACYESVYYSILDYAHWQRMVLENYKEVYGRLPKDNEEYLAMLESLPIRAKSGKIIFLRYASDKSYVKSLKRLMAYTEANPLIVTPRSGGGKQLKKRSADLSLSLSRGLGIKDLWVSVGA